jgi:hypothetical protein
VEKAGGLTSDDYTPECYRSQEIRKVMEKNFQQKHDLSRIPKNLKDSWVPRAK